MEIMDGESTMKTKVTIYKNWCKRCGICVAFCPKKVLAVDQEGYPFCNDNKACTACGLCELRCPDFAVVVDKSSRSIAKEVVEDPVKITSGGQANVEIPAASGK